MVVVPLLYWELMRRQETTALLPGDSVDVQ
jgi:hypothetical protein